MMDIKTYNVIAKEGLAEFPTDLYTVNQSQKPQALLIRSQDMHKTPFGTNVLAIARAGAGGAIFVEGAAMPPRIRPPARCLRDRAP